MRKVRGSSDMAHDHLAGLYSRKKVRKNRRRGGTLPGISVVSGASLVVYSRGPPGGTGGRGGPGPCRRARWVGTMPEDPCRAAAPEAPVAPSGGGVPGGSSRESRGFTRESPGNCYDLLGFLSFLENPLSTFTK